MCNIKLDVYRNHAHIGHHAHKAMVSLMITYDDLGKRWSEKPYRWCEQHALTITDDGVLLGSDCVICKGMAVGEKRFIGGLPHQRMDLNVDGQEGRILALLSLAYGKLIHPNVIRHFRNAARALAKGEHTLAAIHLCHAGLPRFEGDEKRLKLMFQAEQLLDDGMEPGELLKGLDMDMLPAQISGEQWSKYVKAGFNPDEPRDDHGRWTVSGYTTSKTPEQILAEAKAAGGWLTPKDVDPGNEKQCVSLARAVMPDLPKAWEWEEGAKLTDRPAIAPGTAIATFDENGKYKSLAEHPHTAIFLGYDSVNGENGIWVLDQGGHQPAQRTFFPYDRLNTPHGHRAGEFSVIKNPKK